MSAPSTTIHSGHADRNGGSPCDRREITTGDGATHYHYSAGCIDCAAEVEEVEADGETQAGWYGGECAACAAGGAR